MKRTLPPFPKVIKAAAGYDKLPQGPDDPPIGVPAGTHDDISMMDDDLVEQIPESKMYDPVGDILDYILKKPKVTMAVATDYDIVRLCRARNCDIPNDIPVFLDNVHPDVDITEDGFGMLYFEDGHVPTVDPGATQRPEELMTEDMHSDAHHEGDTKIMVHSFSPARLTTRPATSNTTSKDDAPRRTRAAHRPTSAPGNDKKSSSIERSSTTEEAAANDVSKMVPADAVSDSDRTQVEFWNSKPMKVFTEQPLQPTQGKFKYKMTTKQDCDVSLDACEGHWALRRFDPLTRRYAQPRIVISAGGVTPDYILEAVARWNFHLYRFNEPTSDSADDVRTLRPEVQLHALRVEAGSKLLRPSLTPTGDDFFARVKEEEVEYSPTSTYRVLEAVKEAWIHDLLPYYGLTLLNNSDFDLWPYVFYFDPSNYATQCLYRPPSKGGNPPLPKKRGDQPGRLPIGYGASETGSIRFSLPEGASKDTGFLKIFVSTSYVDTSGVEQDALDTRGPHITPRSINDNWYSSVYVLTMSSELSS